MFSLNDSLDYYYLNQPADMRKGFDSLCGLVRSQMNRNPLSGEVFIFINRNCTTVKILRWERGGLVIYHKRLEKGRFELPCYNKQAACFELPWSELVMMIEGISLQDVRRKQRMNGIEFKK